jgi:hypothetical protein
MFYKLYLFDADHRIASRLQLTCKSDQRAIAFIADVASRYGMELWQDDRLVRRQESAHQNGPVIH